MTDFQPTLPAEVPFTEAELNFLEESPPGLFPENQNSNFGYVIRKIFSDQMQDVIDQIEMLYTEKFVSGASELLHLWEADYGLPVAPTGKTIAERRAMVTGRVQIGAFTRDRVNSLIQSYLNATFGTAIAFSPDGVPLVPAGTPLYGDFTPGEALYRVYEDTRNFTYEVWIKNTVTPDIQGMTRELQRITPAGIQFTIDNTKTNVLNYQRTVRNKQPVAYFRLGASDNSDASGYGNTATSNGAPGDVAAPGLLNAAIDDDLAGAGNGARDFSGAAQFINIPVHALYSGMHELTLEAWIRVDAAPPTDYGIIIEKNDSYQMRVGAGNYIGFYVKTTDPLEWAGRLTDGGSISVGSIYHVVGVKRGTTCEIYLNGVRADTSTDVGTVPDTIQINSSPVRIGGLGVANTNFDGVLDEVAIYNYALSPAQILENYRTGNNLA